MGLQIQNILPNRSIRKSRIAKKEPTFQKRKNMNSNRSSNLFKKFGIYKKTRKLVSMKYIDDSFKPFFDKNSQIAIIIPYRNREAHLEAFYQHFKDLRFDVYVIEQCDTQRFNRGLLLNAGFRIASSKKDYDYYIFHDVDSLPDEHLLSLYYYKGDKIIHYASPELGYKYEHPKFFGGVCGMNRETFEKINGYPNNFYGWGGEDDAIYNHIAMSDIHVYRPTKGSYILLDHALPTKNEINPSRAKNILKDLKNWKNYGYKDIDDLYILQNVYPYLSTSNQTKSKSKSASGSKSKLKIDVYQLKIAIVHTKYDDYYSLCEPLLTWDEVDEKILKTYTDPVPFSSIHIKKNTNTNRSGSGSGRGSVEKKIEGLIDEKIDREYTPGLTQEDLAKTLKFIFETYKEILYFRIRNHQLVCAYYLNNYHYQITWPQYIQFPDHMTPNQFLEKRRKELKYGFEPLLPPNKWRANNCVVKIEGAPEDGNPISYVKEIYVMLLNTIQHFGNVPDCDLLINRKDFQYLHSNPTKYAHTYVYPNSVNISPSLMPHKYWIICSQNSTAQNKDVPIPNADEWHDLMAPPMEEVPWKEKEDRVIFRGSSTGCGLDEATNPRIRLSQISHLLNDPFYNIGLSKFVKKIRIQDFTYAYINTEKYKDLLKEFILPKDQMRAKYILNIEGNAAAYRYAGLFRMNSVVIQAESKYYNWFEPLLQEGRDYLLLKKEIFMKSGDSIEVSKEKVYQFFQQLRTQNKEMEKIAKSGKRFHSKYLNETAIYTYYYTLMKKINAYSTPSNTSKSKSISNISKSISKSKSKSTKL